MKVVLVTSGQPSLNPRLVKEADALSNDGFEVTVLYQYWNNWGTVANQELLKNKAWKAICVGGSPHQQPLQYFISRSLHRLGQLLVRYLGVKNWIAELGLKRNVFGLIKKAKSIKADLYIGHNLGALPAVVLASKKHNAKCGFDAEDFHRQEQTDDIKSNAFQVAKFIEDKYLLQTNHLTVASPLIAEAYQKLYPDLNPIVINNVFELKHQPQIELNQNQGLKLFWFSQTIGKNRGLEDVIETLNIINNSSVELHLLGNLSQDDCKYFNDLANFDINYYQPISDTEIFTLASKFDVGLALEPGFCLNNEIALSNKLFTYLISGLAIIASNTKAQQNFIDQNQNIGFLYTIGNITELIDRIKVLLEDKERLNNYKSNAYQLAQHKLNWELESEHFLNIVATTLNN